MASDELLARIARSLDRMEERESSQRAFMRELTERHVSITQHLIGAIAELQAEIRDQREQIQANTQAVLRVLDRMGPAGAQS